MIRIRLPIVIFCLCFTGYTFAGPFTAEKDQACPEVWEGTHKVIPVIGSYTEPWDATPAGTLDKQQVEAHLQTANVLNTLDIEHSTVSDLVDDPLTVASECLVYRNHEADTWNYTAPTSSSTTEFGWIPATF